MAGWMAASDDSSGGRPHQGGKFVSEKPQSARLHDVLRPRASQKLTADLLSQDLLVVPYRPGQERLRLFTDSFKSIQAE